MNRTKIIIIGQQQIKPLLNKFLLKIAVYVLSILKMGFYGFKMRDQFKVAHIISKILYIRLRRTLGKVPFVYAIYSKYPVLRKIDAKLSFLNTTPVLLNNPASGAWVSSADVERELQRLIENKEYKEALYKGSAVLESGLVVSNGVLLGLLNACVSVKSWELLDKIFFPAFEKLVYSALHSSSSIIKEHYQGIVEEFALILIQNAKLDSALKALYLSELIKPKPRIKLLIALLHFIQSEEIEVTRYGGDIRESSPGDEINLVGSIVWGEKYLEGFMAYNVRSMLASGNMPHLKEKGVLVHSIVTTQEGREYIKRHPVYRQLSEVARVEFFCFPEKLLDLFKGEDGPDKWSYLLYGILDHINIFFARSLRANLFLIPVDSIVANPSFTNMRRYITEDGYDCCGGGNLVAERDGFLAALERLYGKSGALEISTKELATLALKHPHNYITSQLIHDDNKSFGKHAREMFWPTAGGVELRSIYTHPLATSAKRICGNYVMPYSWVDFLLPTRLFPDESEFHKYKIINNAEEAYINNYAPDSRMYEVTGRAFHAQDFAAAHVHSHPIHRYMLNTRQFIPCDYPPIKCRNNIAMDIELVKNALNIFCNEGDMKNNNSLPDPMDLCGCHLCGSMNLEEVVNLGDMPLSHHLRKSLAEKELTYPICFHYCNTCGLLQIREPVPPDTLYDAETYSTGFQKPKHIDDLVITALSYNTPGSVLDVGCNDGSLLKVLDGYGFPELVGIEPNAHAANIAKESCSHHIYTNYLTPSVANTLVKKHNKFDHIFARHVLEHVTDLKSFFASINTLLADNGLFIIELPHVETGFEFGNPVILWEEHVNYFTECAVRAMFQHYGLQIIDKRYYAFGGGSVAFIARRKTPEILDVQMAKANDISYYKNYSDKIENLKSDLNQVIAKAKSEGYEIALYGAAPRSCTLMNFAGCGKEIDYIIDDRPDIQGRYMPGTNQVITELDKCAFTNKPLLVLLGVGAENEHKVLARLKKNIGYQPVHISLFPPRNIYDSIKSASAGIELSKQSSPSLKIA